MIDLCSRAAAPTFAAAEGESIAIERLGKFGPGREGRICMRCPAMVAFGGPPQANQAPSRTRPI